MPGFNQRGPNNEGPMTGWGRGICNRSAGTGSDFDGYGRVGFRRGYGRRGGGGVRNTGGFAGYRPGFARQNMEPVEDNASLQEQVDFLEKELASLRSRLEKKNELT